MQDHGRTKVPMPWPANGHHALDPFDLTEGMVYGPPWEDAMQMARGNRAFWSGWSTKATAGIFGSKTAKLMSNECSSRMYLLLLAAVPPRRMAR